MKEQILAVQRMQDYIEKNKAEEIRLSDLARALLFSPWYAYRLFRDFLGLRGHFGTAPSRSLTQPMTPGFPTWTHSRGHFTGSSG